MKILSTKESMNALKDRLASQDKVFYTRFGDGEVFIMDGIHTNRHRADPSMSKEMIESFLIDDPNYMIALSGAYPVEPGMKKGLFAPFGHKDKMLKIVNKHMSTERAVFYNPICFHYELVFHPSRYKEFLDAYIVPYKKLFIGNAPKDAAEKCFGKIEKYFPTIPVNAYYTAHDWWPDVEQSIQQDDIEMVILCVGAAANTFQARLWKMKERFHSLDIGSAVDPFSGDNTRRWVQIASKKIHEAWDV